MRSLRAAATKAYMLSRLVLTSGLALTAEVENDILRWAAFAPIERPNQDTRKPEGRYIG